MKRILIASTAAFLFSCNNEVKNAESTGTDSTSSSKVSSDNKPAEWLPVDSATARKNTIEMGTPGKEQAMLAESNGNWTAEITFWETPESAPMKMNVAVNNKMIYDGRFQLSSFKGDMMGMPFEGSSTTGYDKAKKVWVTTWVDNMSTGIINMEGTWDEATKSVIYTGKMVCPANGQLCEIKQVMKKVDDKTETMEMYGPDIKTGKSYKSMEMVMKKK